MGLSSMSTCYFLFYLFSHSCFEPFFTIVLFPHYAYFFTNNVTCYILYVILVLLTYLTTEQVTEFVETFY